MFFQILGAGHLPLRRIHLVKFKKHFTGCYNSIRNVPLKSKKPDTKEIGTLWFLLFKTHKQNESIVKEVKMVSMSWWI